MSKNKNKSGGFSPLLPLRPLRPLRRRTVLGGLGALGVAHFTRAKPVRAADINHEIFAQGVASGDPGVNRVMLWTRLVGGGTLDCRVARDPELREIVQRRQIYADPVRAGVIKLDIDGLEPGRTYYYGFSSAEGASPVGRTKTLAQGRLERLQLAVCSCSNYEGGYFNNYRAIAGRDELDAVIHLGDYIYEYAPGVYGGHKERITTLPGEALTYGDYIIRYAFYRSDPDLKALHAAHPMIAVWDDHEIANDSWVEGAENHDALEGDYLTRRRQAMRAYYEWMPVRAPLGRLYRSFAFGDLARLVMIDSRHEGRTRNYDWREFFGEQGFDAQRYARTLEGRRIWSAQQSGWAAREGAIAARTARWTLIGNQLPLMGVTMPDLGQWSKKSFSRLPEPIQSLENLRRAAAAAGQPILPVNLDIWQSFPRSRREWMQVLAQSGQVIVLTGDFHTSWAAKLSTGGGSTPFGIELGAPSISSPSFPGAGEPVVRLWQKDFAKANPHMLFAEVMRQGYITLDITRDKAEALWLYNGTLHRRVREEAGFHLEIPRTDPAAAILTGLLPA